MIRIAALPNDQHEPQRSTSGESWSSPTYLRSAREAVVGDPSYRWIENPDDKRHAAVDPGGKGAEFVEIVRPDIHMRSK